MTAKTKSRPARKAIAKSMTEPPPDELSAGEIETRRAELATTIEAEKRARASASIARKPFDPAALIAAEAELEALADAEVEITRRKRAQDAEEIERQREVLRKRVPGLCEGWLDAISEAEAAARAMVAAFATAEAQRVKLEGVARELGLPIATVMSGPEQVQRRARNLSALLRQHIGGDYFGDAHLAASFDDPGGAWSLAEAAAVQSIKSTMEAENG